MTRLRTNATVLLLAALTMSETGCQGAIGVLPGVINDPKNLSLRRSILAYGTSRLCSEMQKRSIPLRLADDHPTTGRYYATSCFVQELANQNLLVQFGGDGFAWTNLTKRMAFTAGGAVEYDHDFLMHDSSMYVYFRPRATTATTFTTTLIEQPAPPPLAGIGLGQSPANYANTFGTQIMTAEIARGFTVIRNDDGSVEFGLGMIERGARPPAPYRVAADGMMLLANERTEVHQNQRDFAGPFEVTDDDMALYLTVSIDGAPGIDVLLVSRGPGSAWLQTYTHQAATTPTPAPPHVDEPVVQGMPWKRVIRVPRGLYYLVLDNTSTAGRTAPTAHALDDRAALVSYAVALGDAP